MDVKNLIETGKRIFGVLKTEQAINAAIGYWPTENLKNNCAVRKIRTAL
jgi:hypothetical protein